MGLVLLILVFGGVVFVFIYWGSVDQQVIYFKEFVGENVLQVCVVIIELQLLFDFIWLKIIVVCILFGYWFDGVKLLILVVVDVELFIVGVQLGGKFVLFIVEFVVSGLIVKVDLSMGICGVVLGQVEFCGVLVLFNVWLGEDEVSDNDYFEVFVLVWLGWVVLVVGIFYVVFDYVVLYVK